MQIQKQKPLNIFNYTITMRIPDNHLLSFDFLIPYRPDRGKE